MVSCQLSDSRGGVRETRVGKSQGRRVQDPNEGLLDRFSLKEIIVDDVPDRQVQFAVRIDYLQVRALKLVLSQRVFEIANWRRTEKALHLDHNSASRTFCGQRSLRGKIGE